MPNPDVTNIPAARVPVVDPRTGFVSREWYAFFLALFGRSGAGLGVDGDKGDIVVSGGNATWTVDDGVIGTAKLGDDITTAGKAILDDLTASAQRITLGITAENVPYSATTISNWDGNVDPDQLQAATDQLARRLTTVEELDLADAIHGHIASDVDGVKVLHGWPQAADNSKLVTLAYSASTRKVTITAVSGGTFDLYVAGEKITVTSPHVSDAHTATAGGWFYYHDGSAWVWSQTPWDMRIVATTCYVYWSTVVSSGVAYNELHCADRDAEWHWVEHFARGTSLISGGVLGDYTLATDTDAAIQFSVTECIITDEDIQTTIAAKADGAGFTIWRRSGTSGIWTWSTSETLPYLFSTYPQRNYDAGGGTGWTMADVTGTGVGEYVTAYVLATPALDSAQRFIVIPGQTAYASLALAQAENISSLSFGTLPWTESCPIAQLVFHGRSIYTNTSNAVLSSVTRLVGTRAVFTGSAAATNHNALSSLQGGTTGEYYHLTAAEYSALAAYSTGTFTPVVEGTTSAGTGTYTVQVGRYTRVGRLVFIQLALTYTGHTGTGNLRIAGLPFTSTSTADSASQLSLLVGSLTFTGQLTAQVAVSTSTVTMWECSSGAAANALAIDAAATIRISGFYEAA